MGEYQYYKLAPACGVMFFLLLSLAMGCDGSSKSSVDAATASAGILDDPPLPGIGSPSTELARQLGREVEGRGTGYAPRTRHLEADGSPRFTNRLIAETSPYLLQHAHNPVNWFAWSDDAFERARRLGRPVLLSVGYSTCHWCHVMEEESFEDEEIAGELNQAYVAIKVDREERPDVDATYMAAVQAMTGNGGWPMTVWLTPDREPFFGGTYFSARDGDRGARTGFLTILRGLAEWYRTEPERVASAAAELVAALRPGAASSDASNVEYGEVLARAVSTYQAHFDGEWGGLAGAPKFPSSLPIRFLLRHQRLRPEGPWRKMAELTLDRMAAGGIRDQLDGGFHRYSTDARWLVPHFEKMLYDNALLASTYLEAHQATGRSDDADVARGILGWMADAMSAPEGGFYSALDADSLVPGGRREEGWYYTWTPDDLAAALGDEDAPAVGRFFGVSAAGEVDGRSVLRISGSISSLAATWKLPVALVQRRVAQARERMLEARRRRPAPLRDDKIVAAWNGLAMSAFAQAALVLGDADYQKRAERAASFILGHLYRGGRLHRSFKDGKVGALGYLDDYAFVIAGLLDLFEASGDPQWLDRALALDQVLADKFEDSAGGYFLTSAEHEPSLARDKPSYDGAEPSGNAVQLMNLLRLHQLSTQEGYRLRAQRLLGAFASKLAVAPTSHSELLLALEFLEDVPKEVAIVVPCSRAEAEPFLARLRSQHLPNRALVVVSEGAVAALADRVPWLAGKVAQHGATTAYVCERQVCALPSTTPDMFAEEIAKSSPRARDVSPSR